LWDEKSWLTKDQIVVIEQQVTTIVDEMVDLWWSTLDDFKNHVQWCVEQYTNQTGDKWEKILWKSITQPTAFTKCVMQWMCKEVWDESQLWLYRIKICKQPARAYNVNANQPVESIEEIIDELSNVCFWMRESGQLLKHNKTKDQWTHKLMNIKFGDKFSFWLTVWFKWPPTWLKDLAAEKRKEVEMNKFMSRLALWFNEDLTLQEEKNKYNLLHEPIKAEFAREEPDPILAAEKAKKFLEARQFKNEYADINTLVEWWVVWLFLEKYEKNQQLLHYSELDKHLQLFVREHIAKNSEEKNIIFLWDYVYHFSYDRKALLALFGFFVEQARSWKNMYVLAWNHDRISNHFVFSEGEVLLNAFDGWLWEWSLEFITSMSNGHDVPMHYCFIWFKSGKRPMMSHKKSFL